MLLISRKCMFRKLAIPALPSFSWLPHPTVAPNKENAGRVFRLTAWALYPTSNPVFGNGAHSPYGVQVVSGTQPLLLPLTSSLRRNTFCRLVKLELKVSA